MTYPRIARRAGLLALLLLTTFSAIALPASQVLVPTLLAGDDTKTGGGPG